jgi:hypothetical protein
MQPNRERAYSSMPYEDARKIHILESPIIKPAEAPDCPPPMSLTPSAVSPVTPSNSPPPFSLSGIGHSEMEFLNRLLLEKCMS